MRPREDAGRELTPGGPGVRRVEVGVDQAVEAHRERSRADHRERDPAHRPEARPAVDREQRADVREGQGEHRVLDPHEARKANRERCRQRGHTASFVFVTRTISSIRISLSTAFAMS